MDPQNSKTFAAVVGIFASGYGACHFFEVLPLKDEVR